MLLTVRFSRDISHMALEAVGRGMEGRAYASIFKDHTQDKRIIAGYSATSTLPLLKGKRFRIICVNTKEDAVPYIEQAQEVYDKVQRHPFVSRSPTPGTLFVGEQFFRVFPDGNPHGDPTVCPAVDGDKFMANAQHRNMPADKTTQLFLGMLMAYTTYPVPPRQEVPGSIASCNEALLLSAEAAATDVRAYVCFAQCKVLCRSRHIDKAMIELIDSV